MISRTRYVGNVVINRLESRVGDLPFFFVFGLGNVSHMDRHDDVHLLLILLDPFGLPKEAGSLISNVRPVLLCLFVPGIGVTLRVRQDDQGKKIGISFGFLIQRMRQLFRVIRANGFIALTCRDRCILIMRGPSCRLDIVGYV